VGAICPAAATRPREWKGTGLNEGGAAWTGGSALLVLACAAWPGMASAQSATASAKTDVRDGQDIVVTASRAGDAPRRDLLGSSATVLPPQVLDDRQVRIVSDVLRDVPGVAVSRTGGVGAVTQVRIRGTESNQVLVIVDGIKASDPFQGEFDFGTLIADDAARVEVLRGQQSSLYGSDAIGGVITYTTLSGRELPGVRARVEGGSFGTVSGAARVAGTAGGDFDYALSGSAQRTGGYPVAPGGRQDIGSTLAGGSAKANWTPAANLRVTLVGRYNHTRAETNDQALAATPPRVDGRPVTTAVDTPGSRFTNDAAYALGRAELDAFNGAMTVAASAQAAGTRRRGYTLAGFSSGDNGARQRYSLEDTVRLGTGNIRHRFTAALDAERERFRNVSPGAFVDRTAKVIHTYGLTGQYSLTVGDRLGFGASLRHDWNDLFRDRTTWHVDASYLLPGATRLHAAAGTGVKSPGPFELFGFSDGQYIGNPDLRPELSRGWEAGVDQAVAGGKVRVGATYFASRLHDEIFTTFVPPDFTATSLNRDGTTRQQGVEAFAQVRLADVRLDASYTYLRAPQSRTVLATPLATIATPVTAQAVRRPRNSASLNVTYAPKAAPFSATLTVRHTGRQKDVAFTPDFVALYADLRAFTLVNVAATYDVTPRLQLFGRVENLFDETYQEVFGYATPGRAGYGGVRLRF